MPASSSFFCITHRPFQDWKHTERNLREARARGFETVVAMDDRCSQQDHNTLVLLADTVIPFTSHGLGENGFRFVSKIRSEFALMVADDEIPSEPLWAFAAKPPSPARYGIPVLPILGDNIYQDHVGIQERLIWVDGWRYLGGFEGDSEGAPKVVLDRNPGILIWHYLLSAPREEREAKVKRYQGFDPVGEHRSRLIYEEHPEGLVPIPAELRQYLR